MSYSTKKSLAKKRTASALAPLLLMGLAAAGPVSGQGLVPGTGSEPVTGLGEACNAKLRCDVGRSLYYDYSASFVGDAELETPSVFEYGAAAITGSTQVAVTAVESREGLCTYAVQLAEVDVKQIADGRVVHSSKGDEEGSTVYDPFYFTQRSDGQLVEVMLGREEMAEVATFKRGVVNALNVTVRDSERYEVMETDISGTHLATYSLSESGKGTSVLTRELRKGGENLLKSDDVQAFNYQATQNTSLEVDLNSCQVAVVNIDEEVVVLEPGAGDPGVSDVFRHERMSVRAAATMILTGSGLPTSSVTLPTKADRADLVRIPVNAAIGESLESLNGGERAELLLAQLRDDADNEQLISELAQMLRNDPAARRRRNGRRRRSRRGRCAASGPAR
ncbi:MAG: hypothetical protein AAFY88_24520, partial [Acidobacteriota bacterium]